MIHLMLNNLRLKVLKCLLFLFELLVPIFYYNKSEPATKNDQQAIRDLLDTIEANAERCVGMAANMIGVRKTILVTLISKDYLIMVNPKIIDHSKQYYDAEEGCLSLTGQRPAKRYPILA